MENVIQNPGLQHITEKILSNLNYESLQKCQIVNKSLEDFLGDPMFWLRKWRTQRGLSKENYDDWVKAIKLTKNTNVEANMKLYLEKVVKNGHVLDVPCVIDSDAVEKSSEFTFRKAFEEKKLGILQILAIKNPNLIDVVIWIRNPRKIGGTPIFLAAAEGVIDILKFLVTFTNDPNIQDADGGRTPIMAAAGHGHIDVLKFLAPLTKDPNRGRWGLTAIQFAQMKGHHKFARLLQTFINTGHF